MNEQENDKEEILGEVLKRINSGIKLEQGRKSDQFDNAVTLCIKWFPLFTFDYEKGYSGHVDFDKVFHNGEIRKLQIYLFESKKYDVLDKHIATGEDMLTFFSTFYPDIYIEWETRDLDLKLKNHFLDFTEYKLCKGVESFKKIGEFLSRMTDDKILESDYPEIFRVSRKISKKYNFPLIEEENNRTETESQEMINKYLKDGMEYANASGGELWVSSSFTNITDNKYSNYILDEENMTFTNGDYKGSIIRVDQWKEELNIKLNKWIHNKKVGDLNDSINSKITYEVSNIISNDFISYELDYDHSGQYVWCDGFQYLWIKEGEKYTIEFSLDD